MKTPARISAVSALATFAFSALAAFALSAFAALAFSVPAAFAFFAFAAFALTALASAAFALTAFASTTLALTALAFSAFALSTLPVFSTLSAQPSSTGPMPSQKVVQSTAARRAQYEARIDEVLDWRAGLIEPGDKTIGDMAAIATLLVRGRDKDIERCNAGVIAHMREPGSGPFWMFPCVSVAFLGRDTLSPETRAAIRAAWSSRLQVRGDTENHWAMYYASLYLMSELYPNEPGNTWFTGKSSCENLAESRDYLISWMDLTTTVGQGEFTCTHYIGEYAIALLYLATWAEDPAMRIRAHMLLDWILADQFANSLNGVLHGANARADDIAVIERWSPLSTFFSWLLLGNTPPPPGYGGFGIHFAVAAKNYELPEVIYRIGVDRDGDFLQQDLKRSRRRWRYSDELFMPVFKTNYSRKDYAVGSCQGGLADPIQTHVWDVTWAVPDPRGMHCTMFSLHPVSSGKIMQTYFAELPDQMVTDVAKEGKPSYDMPGKLLGCSPHEKVFQDRDTIIALYDIPAGTRFPHINGFFSKDLRDVVEDASGWIFAKGGNTYLAYRPLAAYKWIRMPGFATARGGDREETGGRILQSPHLKNGAIVQAASADEFKSYEDFQNAIKALPLSFNPDPVPAVTMTTLRGSTIAFTYGEPPRLNGKPVDYAGWKLFQGPYLNAERGSRKLTLTHGRLERILDFNTLTITDRVKE